MTPATRAAGLARVSVVIPAFNSERFLGAAIESLVAQTYPGWECIVVDDGSTDDTAEVARGYAAIEPRVQLLSQANAGPAAARNRGLAGSRGDLVQFLDADDLLERRKLEAHVALLAARPDLDLVCGGFRFFRDGSPEERLTAIPGQPPPAWTPLAGRGDDVLLPLLRENVIVVSAPLLRRRVVDRVGPFDAAIAGLEDWDYWIRCALAGLCFATVDGEETRTLVRVHPASVSQRKRELFAASDDIQRKFSARVDSPEACAILAGMRTMLDGYRDWLERIDRTARDLREAVPAGTVVHLVDEDEIRGELLRVGCPVAPFPQADGHYAGRPGDGPSLVADLERARAGGDGACHLAVAWPAFWWLDHYAELAAYLCETGRLLRENDRVRVFELPAVGPRGRPQS